MPWDNKNGGPWNNNKQWGNNDNNRKENKGGDDLDKALENVKKKLSASFSNTQRSILITTVNLLF